MNNLNHMQSKIITFTLALAMVSGTGNPVFAASTSKVSAITSISAVANVAQILSAEYSDTDGIMRCSLYVNGKSQGGMALSSNSTTGIASILYTFASIGTYKVQARCVDSKGTSDLGAITNIKVTTVNRAIVGRISPIRAGVNVGQSFNASYLDSEVVSSCTLYVDGQLAGGMDLIGSSTSGIASRNYTFAIPGNYTLQARCTDVGGQIGEGLPTVVAVLSSTSPDTTPPSTPSNFSLYAVGTNNNTLVRWSASSDNVGVANYQISLDGSEFMPIKNVLAYATGPLAGGTYTIAVRAEDEAGNVSGASSLKFAVNTQGPRIEIPSPAFFPLESVFADATTVTTVAGRTELQEANGSACELRAEDASSRVAAALGIIADAGIRAMIENFVACGTSSSMYLGAGERLGIINSYRYAFGRLPSTQGQWYDVLKIGNGRFPGETSASAQARAKANFHAVFLRDPSINATEDTNAVTVMAYGLRPLPRNMDSEVTAISTFRFVYHRGPASASDWDIVRSVAYSGAVR